LLRKASRVRPFGFDANNKVTFYRYDSLDRLVEVSALDRDPVLGAGKLVAAAGIAFCQSVVISIGSTSDDFGTSVPGPLAKEVVDASA
jgi:hypothetical protein